MIPLLFPRNVYAKRRAAFAQDLVAGRDLVVLFTAPQHIRNQDTHFLHRPDSSFLYLTGYAEASAACLIWKEGKRVRFCLFTLPRDRSREQWDGYRYGPERARALAGADDSGEISQLGPSILRWLAEVPTDGVAPRLLTNASLYKEHEIFLQRTLEGFHPALRRNRLPLAALEDVELRARDLRTVKDKHEIEIMRKSSKINVAAHLKVMEAIRPGMHEYELQAVCESEFTRHGCVAPAYPSICASGANATVLHYNDNSRKMKDGELFLIDAGCEYKFYASDITRTIPVSGKYTKQQRIIMDIVAEAHRETVAMVKPGVPYAKMHERSTEALVDGLRSIKLLKGSRREILETGSHRRYYPHGTGHWLGMDVHDPCPYVDSKGRSLKLAPGHVFTVEPGLYFMADDRTVPAEWRGIGVRIEDDILVTSKGSENLTKGLPRYAAEIERHMARSRS
jgi:Xaa-Pro aminopeptidase